jgi:hypothetical protein
LANLGIRIPVVFYGLEAQRVEKRPIARVFTDKNDLRLVNGSRKPFINNTCCIPRSTYYGDENRLLIGQKRILNVDITR